MKALSALLSLLLSSSPWAGSDVLSPSKIKDDEQVVLFPAEAYHMIDTQHWDIYLHGWIFEPQSLGEISAALRKALGLPSSSQSENSGLLRQRLKWFMVDNERGKRVPIKLGNKIHILPKSTANGHFSDTLTVNDGDMHSLRKTVTRKNLGYRVNLPTQDNRTFDARMHLVPATGLSVISDIDDTIKISQVSDKKELIKNTFLRPFQAAPGMATLYRQWQQQHDAVFHYVSASPWQLYPALAEFVDEQAFPQGLFYMKDFRWKDSSFLNLFADPVEYKLGILEPLLKRYPQRRFILVGDSGERDPEVYATLARKYPLQIERVLIRAVGDNNSQERFNAAFSGLQTDLWQVFKQTSEIDRIW